MTLPDLLAVGRGEQPADLLLRNGRILNVFSGQIECADIAVHDGKIAGIGSKYRANVEIDLANAMIAPGLIDAHVHIESSLCVPARFAAAVIPRGVTSVVIDPHEIANVAGMDGIRFMARSSRSLPLNVVMMAPSCVPATQMQTNGASLDADNLATLLADGTVHGLGEVMNFPSVVAGEPGVLSKLNAFGGHPQDGHAPGLAGMALNAYAASGIGSDHECTTVAEAQEKLALGLYILVREATNAHNLHDMLPLITPQNSRRICFCTDDRMPGDLLTQGSIDYMVREAVAYGIDPVDALRMATLNPAEYFALHDRGAIAPGRAADLIVFDDINDFRPNLVFVSGQLVSEEGQILPEVALDPLTSWDGGGTHIQVDWSSVNFRIPAHGTQARVIGVLENQLVTEMRILPVSADGDEIRSDRDRDILKIAVIDRHKASGSMSVGLIQGIGLKRGAMAGTVAHDHHNLVVIGLDDASMMTAARAVAEIGGGLVVADGDHVMAQLPLPVAGLMSNQPIAEVRASYDRLLAAASDMGSKLHDPFMTMSFMALEVIPKLKLTDLGLVDVEEFTFVDLFI